jgi:hypothetical protein
VAGFTHKRFLLTSRFWINPMLQWHSVPTHRRWPAGFIRRYLPIVDGQIPGPEWMIELSSGR